MKIIAKLFTVFLILCFVQSLVVVLAPGAVNAKERQFEKNEGEPQGQPPAEGPGGKPGLEGKPGKPVDFIKTLPPEQREEAKKVMMLINSYRQLGDAYAESGDADQAVAQFKKIADFKVPSYFPADEVKDRKAMIGIRIIEIYMKCGKEDKALAEAEALMASGQLDTERQAHLFTIMGNVYKKNGNNAKAIEMFKKSVDLLEKDVKK